MRGTSRTAVLASVVAVSLLPAVTEAAPPPISTEPTAQIEAPHAPDRVIVGFRSGVTAVARARTMSGEHTKRHRRLSPNRAGVVTTEVVELAAGVSVEDALAAFAADPNVAFVEPDYLLHKAVTSNDPVYTAGNLWGMEGDASSPANAYGSGAAEAWSTGYTGSRDVVVGVIDEGIQFDHPDLAANVWTNPFDPVDGVDNDGNGYIDDVHGWDFFNNDSTIFDGAANPDIDAHGTHVAGTIGGVGGNGQGVAGVNWQVTMISAKFLGPDGGNTSDAIAALNYLVDLKVRHGINIVATSNSWGGTGFDLALQNAINDAADHGMLFIAAAGNDATNNDVIPHYPANYDCTRGGTRGWDCIISVAAIASNGTLASFSQYGASSVDLGAPGASIASTVPNNSYAYYSGTSMATPHVAGAVALCASIDPAKSAAALRAAIIGSVAPTASLAGKTVTGGRLDIGAMVGQCTPPAEPVAGSVTDLSVAAVTETSVQLAWTDTVAHESSFEVEAAPSTNAVCGAFSAAGSAASGASSFTVGSLPSSSEWCFRIRGVSTANGGSSTAWSNVVTATTTEPVPYSCARATYQWFDTSAGTGYFLGDDWSVQVTMPFAFEFYGESSTSLSISANGYVRPGGGVATAYSNTSLPNTADPNNLIAVWWDDLDPSLGGSVRTLTTGTAPHRRFVISWNDVPHHASATSGISVQVVLDEGTNLITLTYLDPVTGDPASSQGAGATIGVENSTGTMGTSVSTNSPQIGGGTAYRCTNRATLQAPVITTTSLPSANVGRGYSTPMQVSGGTAPYTWVITGGSTPPGLTLYPWGAIAGVPTTMGTWWMALQVTDAGGLVTSKVMPLTVLTALPGSFNKAAPGNGLTGRSRTSLRLSWAASRGATSYQYCVDTINDNQCNGTWITTRLRYATIRRLGSNTTYYWQVRAVNPGGTTEANGGVWFRFTTRR